MTEHLFILTGAWGRRQTPAEELRRPHSDHLYAHNKAISRKGPPLHAGRPPLLHVRCKCMAEGQWPVRDPGPGDLNGRLNFDWLYEGPSLSDAAEAYRQHVTASS